MLGVALAADRAAQRRCQTLLSQFVPEAGLFRLGQRVEYVRPERVRTGCGQRGFHFRWAPGRRERTGQSGGIDHQLRGRSRVGRRSGCIGGGLRLARGLDALHGGLNGSRNVRLRRGRSLRPVVVEQSATQREPAHQRHPDQDRYSRRRLSDDVVHCFLACWMRCRHRPWA